MRDEAPSAGQSLKLAQIWYLPSMAARKKHRNISRKLLLCGIVLAAPLRVTAKVSQDVASAEAKHAIVSPSVPRDSRGETVYELQGYSQKDVVVVRGELRPPVLVKQPKPKFPKSLRKSHAEADVTLQGVVTADGDCIDLIVVGSSSAETVESAESAALRYKFQPATLDGRPVASLLQIVVHFER